MAICYEEILEIEIYFGSQKENERAACKLCQISLKDNDLTFNIVKSSCICSTSLSEKTRDGPPSNSIQINPSCFNIFLHLRKMCTHLIENIA